MKTKANISIKNRIEENKYDVEIEINDKKEYIYIENNNTKVIFNSIKKEIIRNNNELYMRFQFDLEKQTDGIIKVKDLDKTLKVKIKTKKVDITKNKIEIKYELEDEEYTYKIDME